MVTGQFYSNFCSSFQYSNFFQTILYWCSGEIHGAVFKGKKKKSSNTFLSLPLFTYVCFINLGRIKYWSFWKSCGMIQFEVTEVFYSLEGGRKHFKNWHTSFFIILFSFFLCWELNVNKISSYQIAPTLSQTLKIFLYFWLLKSGTFLGLPYFSF